MPTAWSPKRERQYQHIKEDAQKRGIRPRRAKEIAARTVNKQRRLHEETSNRRTQGTGNPNSPLEERSRQELYNRAAELGVRGRSRMDKTGLIRAIRRAG